jgi:hypothetical protein
MKKIISFSFIFSLVIVSIAFAGEPKVYSNEDLDSYRHNTDDSKAAFPEGYETTEQYIARREKEEALKDAHYGKQAIEIDRICREEVRHREGLQQQEDIKEEIQILKGNLAVQRYGDYPWVKVARDQTRKRFSPQEFYYNCIKDSGIPPKYFGLDRW